jgi:transposase InsO family protein
MHCVKCRKKTETKNLINNSRNMIKGQCVECGKYKTSFVKKIAQGTGFSLNSFVNNLPIELHQFSEKGEYVPEGSFNDQQKYSFCGPGTRYEQRMREGYKGINELDSMCKLHDQFYNENTETKTRNISDIALAHRAAEIARNSMYDDVQRKDARFISDIMKTKAKYGLGLPWNEELANELHAPVKRVSKRRHVVSYGVDDVWSCDLVEMQEWSKQNNGYRYLLNIVDVYSKFAWSIPLLDKKSNTVLEAFKNVVKSSGRKPRHLWVDEGKEFYNSKIDVWIKENKITRYSTHGEHKSSIVERFNRNLKSRMWKRFTAENTRNWVDMLDKLMYEYNSTVHSTIKMTPTEALTNKVASRTNVTIDVQPKFKIGDRVRVSRIKGLFEKGYLPNWSEALYTVHEVRPTDPVTYVLKDLNDEIVVGGFYTEELQKSQQEVFRIEKVLERKKIKGVEHGLVKWLGYNKKYNEWRPMSEIEKLH